MCKLSTGYRSVLAIVVFLGFSCGYAMAETSLPDEEKMDCDNSVISTDETALPVLVAEASTEQKKKKNHGGGSVEGQTCASHKVTTANDKASDGTTCGLWTTTFSSYACNQVGAACDTGGTCATVNLGNHRCGCACQ